MYYAHNKLRYNHSCEPSHTQNLYTGKRQDKATNLSISQLKNFTKLKTTTWTTA